MEKGPREGALYLNFDFDYRPGMIRIVQFACIAVTAAILYAVMKGVDGVKDLVGDRFDAGFVIGGALVMVIWVISEKFDLSSSSGGGTTEHESFDDGIDKRGR